MDGATIAMFVFQTVITAIIGVAAWGVKNAMGDLKADLPLIYTTREDFIRVSNNIDQKLDKLLYRGAAKEG